MSVEECFVSRECKFDAEDLDCLHRLERECYSFYYFTDPNKPREDVRADQTFVMMVDDKQNNRQGVATGSVRWQLLWSGGKMRLCGELFRLRVNSAYRRRGLGRFLAEKLEEVLVERGVNLLYCTIWTPNPPSECLIEKSMKMEKVYTSPMRMLNVDWLAKEQLSSSNDRSFKVERDPHPIDALSKLFGNCLLWPQDVTVLNLVIYQVELPDGKGTVRAVLWLHNPAIAVGIMSVLERLSVFGRRILSSLMPSYVEKPIDLDEKIVVRFLYPILIPEKLQLAEVAAAVKAILHTVAVDSRKVGVNYLIVPIHPQVSHLTPAMLNSNIFPFSNLFPGMEHSFYVKILPSKSQTPKEAEEFRKELTLDAVRGQIFINAAEL